MNVATANNFVFLARKSLWSPFFANFYFIRSRAFTWHYLIFPSLNHRFPKSERITNKILIDRLFREGLSTFSYPFKVLYILHKEPQSHFPSVLITLSKRKIRRAVDRNWIKRRIKEAYRLQKHQMLDQEGNCSVAHLVIIYVAKEKLPYSRIHQKLAEIIQHFRK